MFVMVVIFTEQLLIKIAVVKHLLEHPWITNHNQGKNYRLNWAHYLFLTLTAFKYQCYVNMLDLILSIFYN